MAAYLTKTAHASTVVNTNTNTDTAVLTVDDKTRGMVVEMVVSGYTDGDYTIQLYDTFDAGVTLYALGTVSATRSSNGRVTSRVNHDEVHGTSIVARIVSTSVTVGATVSSAIYYHV